MILSFVLQKYWNLFFIIKKKPNKTQTAGWFITHNVSPMQILSVLGLFVLLWVLPQFLIRFQQLCTNCFMSACEGEKRPTPKGHLAVTNACIILLKIRAFSEIGLHLQKLMHIQVGSEINPHPMYRHSCQATLKSLLYHKLYHDFTFTSCRWHIQISSSQMLRTVMYARWQAHSYRLLSALSLLRSRCR